MRRTARSGYTLIEVMIAVGLLTIAVATTLSVMHSSMRGFDHSVASTRVNADLARGMSRITRRITPAGLATLAPALEAPFSSERIGFQEVVAWNAGAPVWSNDMEIRLEYEDGELDNGIDDDGDGFADEGQVVLIEDVGTADERRIVLVKSVREFLEGEEPGGGDENGNGLRDERGLCFEMRDDAVVVRLSVLRNDPQVGTLLRTLETTIHTRN